MEKSGISKKIILGVLLIFILLLAVVVILLAYLFPDLSMSTQAVVLATIFGGFGTLALAGVTLMSILQSRKILEIRTKEHQRPLIIEEISYLLQPAIFALRNNRSDLKNPRYNGCFYEWTFIKDGKVKPKGRGPVPVQYANTLDLSRFESENPELYQQLRRYDQQIDEIASLARKFHNEVSSEVADRLQQEGFEEDDERELKRLTSSILLEVTSFAERSEYYDFWESHGNSLMEYARTSQETTLQDIKFEERKLLELTEDLLGETSAWKQELQAQYSIADGDLYEVEKPASANIS